MNCKGSQWLKTVANCNILTSSSNAKMSLGWFIYTWASMKFFRHFTVKKTSLLLPAERLSCLYIQWAAFKYAICKEFFMDKISLAPKFLECHRRIKCSETVFGLGLSKKRWVPMKTIHQLSSSVVKMFSCCLPGIIIIIIIIIIITLFKSKIAQRLY